MGHLKTHLSIHITTWIICRGFHLKVEITVAKTRLPSQGSWKFSATLRFDRQGCPEIFSRGRLNRPGRTTHIISLKTLKIFYFSKKGLKTYFLASQEEGD